MFATHAHAELFRAGVGAAADDPRVAVCGWPMEYLAAELQPHLAQPKENIVLFPHRLAPEKQPEIFKDLAGSFPDWQFVACQEDGSQQVDYHDLLARSRVVFSCSLQETLGIGCYEGVLAGRRRRCRIVSATARCTPRGSGTPRSGLPAGRHTSGISRNWWRTSRRCWIAWSPVGTA